MPNEMTIQQAADYLRENLPHWYDFLLREQSERHSHEVFLVITWHRGMCSKDFSPTLCRRNVSLSDAVRAAADWAKGQEAGNG